MTSQTRVRFTAQYSYPGSSFPETSTREIVAGTYAAAVEAKNDAGWYAVEVTKITERRYEAENGNFRWIAEQNEKIGSWVVGQKIHVDDIPDTDENRILRSNIRSNSKDGFAVKTRCGNWQMASDYSGVVAS